MSHTNETPFLHLPQFVVQGETRDKPAWLEDINPAFAKVDENAQAQSSTIESFTQDIGNLQQTVTTLGEGVTSAQTSASNAVRVAGEAKAAATSAENDADTALTTATTASNTADTALTKATTASNTADAASTAVSTLKDAVDDWVIYPATMNLSGTPFTAGAIFFQVNRALKILIIRGALTGGTVTSGVITGPFTVGNFPVNCRPASTRTLSQTAMRTSPAYSIDIGGTNRYVTFTSNSDASFNTEGDISFANSAAANNPYGSIIFQQPALNITEWGGTIENLTTNARNLRSANSDGSITVEEMESILNTIPWEY